MREWKTQNWCKGRWDNWKPMQINDNLEVEAEPLIIWWKLVSTPARLSGPTELLTTFSTNKEVLWLVPREDDEIEHNKNVRMSTETCIMRKVLKANEIEHTYVRTHWDASSLDDVITLQDDKIITRWNVNSAMTHAACVTISRAS